MRVPLILDAKKDCSRHALQSPDFSYCEVNPLLFRLPLSPLLLRLQSVCLYRSYRPAARQAAAARWISPHCCSGRKIDLPKYDTGLQGHRIPVNSAVVPCSRYSQGSAGKYYNSSLTFLRLSPYSFLAAFIAAPKALKSYNGTGLFAIFIHPVTFYSSPFFLDMSTQFISLG